ncbi:Sulfatase [Rosistilla ulvae]|uniref:Sulfatase n=1 Tax=Rosistilla ulvae TaxID=1930277 RepID=A0A517M4I2_9BACT|nr:Sulfatase [Rosistilla ulvae]
MFTDAYGQQSCTAGRAAFITGQSPKRTGLLKIGIPGEPTGLQSEAPTLAELLKPYGDATGQFGKNHLGNLDEFLPTNGGTGSWFFAQQPRKAPLIIDLRADPFEIAPEDSSYYDDWLVRHIYVMVPVKALVADLMETFKDFPPRQESGSFTPKQ